jgi:uncharacterized protein (DUF433 family)/rubredoxin
MRNRRSNHAATRRKSQSKEVCKEVSAEALEPLTAREVSEREGEWTNWDKTWEEMPALGAEWPSEGWDRRPMTTREAGVAAGLYDYPEGYFKNIVRYVVAAKGGVAHFRGSGVPVDTVLALLDKGVSWRRVRRSWPFLTRGHIGAARAFLAEQLRKMPATPTTEDKSVPQHVKCSQCGWVHVVLTPQVASEHALTAEQMAGYRRCGRCGAEPATFSLAMPGDAQTLATLPACIWRDDLTAETDGHDR